MTSSRDVTSSRKYKSDQMFEFSHRNKHRKNDTCNAILVTFLQASIMEVSIVTSCSHVSDVMMSHYDETTL